MKKATKFSLLFLGLFNLVIVAATGLFLLNTGTDGLIGLTFMF